MLLNATPCCPGVVVSYRCTVQVPTILCEQEVNNVVAITNADNFNVFTVITLFILDSNIVVFYGLYNCFIFLACRERIAYNGSADLRSPKKEVCFRSWDLANSQMCEVRVATSNICGCNPPNRCGKRSGADFATSFRVLPKAGKFITKVQSKNEC